MTDEPTSPDPIGPERLDDDVLGGGADDTISQPAGGSQPAGDSQPAGGSEPVGNDPAFGSGGAATMAPPPPQPAPPPPPQARRLVRDPTATLGGVASGLARYYGIDTSIVRILFLILAFTTGFGFLAYLIAWLIIPRADHWPPAGPARPIQSMSGRDLGLMLAIGGLLLVLLIGAGEFGSVLVPLVLVGGGVWLLVQQPGTGQVPAVDHVPHAGGDSPPPPPPPPAAYVVGPQGEPVAPRSRRRKAVIIGLLMVLTLIIVVPLALIGVLIGALASGDVDFDFGDPVRIDRAPQSVEAFPLSINRDSGEVTIDLTDLSEADIDDLAALDDRAEMTVDLDYGAITVIVPEDLPVAVDAEVGVGSVEVFDRRSDGLDSDLTRDDDAAVIDIELDVGLGEITVERG